MRLTDNKALQSASAAGDVVPLFVVDPRFENAGMARRAFMFATLQKLNEATGGKLVLRYGDPCTQVAQFAATVGASSVHITQDFAPYGIARDALVRQSLEASGVAMVQADSPYCVNPGVVLKDDGTPLKVFTPFYRRWSLINFSSAIESSVTYADAKSHCQGYRDVAAPTLDLPAAGEDAAWQRWEQWFPQLESYKDERNNPGVDGTSLMSPYLRFGVVHPRQLIARMNATQGADHYRRELAWREFYADVLFHQPHTMWENLQTKMNVLALDTDAPARARFETFCAAQTGFPIVDAGIRQMLATGIMHNRVRMIVASFLVKDLHLPWQWGARFFMQHLVDGDIASNNHGWQWTSGTGTDAAPFFRVFNPTSQSAKFDPTGTYVRRWVPELSDLDNVSIHEPSLLGLLAPAQYPKPMVNHSDERIEALARYKSVTAR